MRFSKFLLTFLIVVLGYELMTIALPLMNKPSTMAFYAGSALLFVIVVGTAAVLRLLWRRS